MSLLEAVAREKAERPRETWWGGWTLQKSNYTLQLHDMHGNWRYEIDLERCLSSAQVLDWIMQVSMKQWATPQVVAGLVRALDEVLYPQANLCSGGGSKLLTNARLRELVEGTADE